MRKVVWEREGRYEIISCAVAAGQAVSSGQVLCVGTRAEEELDATIPSGGYIQYTYQEEKEPGDGNEVAGVTWREQDEGVLCEWLVEVGDVVEHGQPVAVLRKSHPDSANSLNGTYQRLLIEFAKGALAPRISVPDMTVCCVELSNIVTDFLAMAKRYAKVIIGELRVPLEQKTIRPVDIGGALGGSKYVVSSILFKVGDGELCSRRTAIRGSSLIRFKVMSSKVVVRILGTFSSKGSLIGFRSRCWR